MFGPMPSVVLAGADAAISSFNHKKKRIEPALNVGVTSLMVFVSGWAVTLTFGEINNQPSGTGIMAQAISVGELILAAGMLILIYYGLKSAVDGSLKQNRQPLKAWRDSFLWHDFLPLALVPYSALAIVCAAIKLLADLSFTAFIIASLLAITAYLTYKVYAEKIQASNLHAEQMANLHLRTIEALAIAVDAKDEVTHDHVFRVRVYATGLAKLFGLSDLEIEALKAGALLHDIGKIAVPDYILNKPGKLTPAEFEEMKMHTIIGAEILSRVNFPYPVVPIVRHHHERWDGRGYPDGLRGEEIPITARIISVVDCFDAVREDRQYRKAMTREEAIALLQANSGTMYDPDVVAAFIEHLPEFEAEIRNHKTIAANGKREKSTLFRSRPQGADEQILDQIRNANNAVDALYKVVDAIGESLDLRDALTIVSTRLQDIVSYTTCALYLLRKDSTEIEAVHVSGRHADLLRGCRITSGAGISGWVVANGHPMHNSDPRLDFDAMKKAPPAAYRTSTVVPLLRSGRVLGALAVYSTEVASYNVDQLRLLEAVAKLISDALAKAGAQDVKRADELTDEVTGLANAVALRRRFEIAADRAERHSEKFSIVMMDIDGFKQINKMIGKQDADHLLWEVARQLSALIQQPNFVCRYTGDKFVALIEGAPEEIIEIARSIQRKIDKHDFGFASSSIFIGMSIGAADYGADGCALDELLVAATRAMSADKANRKTIPSGPLAAKPHTIGDYKVM